MKPEWEILLLGELEMALSDTLDLNEVLSRAAEPNMKILALHSDLLGELGNFQSGFSGSSESGKDFGFESAAFRARACFFRSGFAGECNLFSSRSGLALNQRGDLCVDFRDLQQQGLFPLSKFNEFAQRGAIDIG